MGHNESNAASRSRLQDLVANASDADLRRPTDVGWTVAATLAHLAFWDRFVHARWRAVLDGADMEPAVAPPGGIDWTNAAALPQWSALAPRAAAQDAIDAAAELDDLISRLPASAVQRVSELGRPGWLDRTRHRGLHLDQMAAAFNPRTGTPGAAIADELEAKFREIEATLRQASDAQWRTVCPSEGWPVGLVAFHLALHMERPAGWLEDALAGKPPFEFSSAETDALNAAVAGYGILPSKGFVLGALAGAWSRMRAALHALTDADLERVALIDRSGGAGEAKVATVRGMMRVVMRRTDDHIASIRGAMAGAA